MTSVALEELSKVPSDVIRVVSTWALKIAKTGGVGFQRHGQGRSHRKAAAKLHYGTCTDPALKSVFASTLRKGNTKLLEYTTAFKSHLPGMEKMGFKHSRKLYHVH